MSTERMLGGTNIMPRISVAMATYNGERFIAEQLESILAQTIVPDEIIISDDGSTDDTVTIAEEILRESGVAWKIISNKYDRGYTANFSTALEATTGEIVFISDQDDVWMPGKVESIVEAFANSCAELVVHDSLVFWTDASHQEEKFSNTQKRRGLNPRNHIFGCMMAVRRSLLRVALPLDTNELGHDQLLSFYATSRGMRVYLDMPLMYYRRHGGNFSKQLFEMPVGSQGRKYTRASIFNYAWLAETTRQITIYTNLVNRQFSRGISVMTEEQRGALNEKHAKLTIRHKSLIEGKALAPLMKYRDYRRLGIPFRAWAKDSVAALFRLHKHFTP